MACPVTSRESGDPGLSFADITPHLGVTAQAYPSSSVCI